MAEATNNRKVASYGLRHLGRRTDDGDREEEHEVIYCETIFHIKILLSSWHEKTLSPEDAMKQVADEFTHSKYSYMLHDLLSDKAISISTYPLLKWNAEIDERLPEGQRRRKPQAISEFLNYALRTYLSEHSDTPDKDLLLEWVCGAFKDNLISNKYKWVSWLEGGKLTFYEKSTGQGGTILKSSYIRKYNQKIGTKSYNKEFHKELKKDHEKMNKKPRGRPRKNPPY